MVFPAVAVVMQAAHRNRTGYQQLRAELELLTGQGVGAVYCAMLTSAV